MGERRTLNLSGTEAEELDRLLDAYLHTVTPGSASEADPHVLTQVRAKLRDDLSDDDRNRFRPEHTESESADG